MWTLARDEQYDRDEKQFGKKYRDELEAILDNLDTLHHSLLAGVPRLPT